MNRCRGFLRFLPGPCVLTLKRYEQACVQRDRSAALPAIRGENSRKVNKPPFRSRRGTLTADSAAARIHFRRTSHSHDICLTEMRAVIRAQRYGDVP
jgi:hypothetical protein